MALTGEQLGELRDAICAAFDARSLTQWARTKLDLTLANVVQVDNPLETVAYDLLVWAEQQGLTETLILELYKARPRHPKVLEYCQKHFPAVLAPPPEPRTDSSGMQVHTVATLVTFMASLVLGGVQVLLAFVAGVGADGVAEGAGARSFFGYIRTYHWWVTYVTVVPVILAFSAQSIIRMGRLALAHREWRRRVVATALLSLVVVGAFSLKKFHESSTVDPAEYCQWNYLACRPADVPFKEGVRFALRIVSYSHYAMGYAALVFNVLTTTWLAAYVRRRKRQIPDAVSELSDLLLSQKIVAGAYLFYLALLRSSRVGMELASQSRQPSASLGELIQGLSPNFEATRSGLPDLGLGLAWVAFCFFTHLLWWRGQNEELVELNDVNGIVRSLMEAYALLGRTFTTYASGCLLLIILPPTSGYSFMTVLGLLVVVVALVARTQQRRDVAVSNVPIS